MAGPSLTTDALVLFKRPPTDAFQTLTVFSAEHGPLLALQRLPKKTAPQTVVLDLFDEASLLLETSNQGQTWFIKESRLVVRHPALGRDYDTLRLASSLALLAARNTVPEESRASVYTLLREAFAAFAAGGRPDIVYLKSLYRFARDEGYPVKEQWFPALSAPDREAVAEILRLPLADQTAPPALVARLQTRLETYLRGHTEVLLD